MTSLGRTGRTSRPYRAKKVEVADRAYTAWLAETVVTRDLAERATCELRARGVDLADRSDHVQADEWLAAHRAAQDDDDQRQHVEEHEVADDDANRAELDPAAGPVGETAVPDIREVATPHPVQPDDTGPQARRSARPPDETAAVVARGEELARWSREDREAEQQQAARAGDELVREAG